MQENYLAKWLNNDLSEDELAVFKKSAEYASYEKLMEVSGTLEAPDFDMDKALNDLNNNKLNKDVKVITLNPLRKLWRLAAAIAVIFIASYFYISTLDESVSTQYAERSEVRLPDNSEIILNADSRITYSEKNWDKERNISLRGEAFFKVAKGQKFTVATNDGLVTVLGTQFNVENRKGFFEVTCYEGLVSVIFNGEETKLPAGNSFIAINGSVLKTESPVNTTPSWMSNESTFKSIPLNYVLDEFERQYDVKIKTQNVNLEQLFTGSFSNTNINLALQSISTPSQIKYELEGNNVLFYAENAP
ncbi:FecR family protein [uncultured Eudoraea sp.]|jgi:ferric-dicitrate binding protein FerR (iron transport regulator)|uniref:FecR family protein n=1 Tax=uncultured Eudoraea sp. TaxID=1035614 RepID=UPI00262EAF41|nr:FecR family protein [uncultured Eudoraea sp.]